VQPERLKVLTRQTRETEGAQTRLTRGTEGTETRATIGKSAEETRKTDLQQEQFRRYKENRDFQQSRDAYKS
jgi:hypothetical protein